MENAKIFTVVYVILVVIDGIMSFTYYRHISGLLVQFAGGVSIAICWFYFRKKQKHLLFIIPSIGFILMGYYGYVFFQTTDFFQGLMAGLSAFFVGSYVIEILKYYSKISKL
jgi:hypothetical protein